MNLNGKKKGILLLMLLLVLLVCGGIYTAYRLHPEDFVGKNDIITRGEFAADLAKELKLDISNSEQGTPDFFDIDGHWAKKYIGALVDAGIIDPTDYPDGFKPDEPITLTEIIKMMVRVKGQDEEAQNTKGHSGYDDQLDISEEDKGYVIVGKEDGIIGETKDNTLHPNNPVTKGEADDMINKAIPKSSTSKLFATKLSKSKPSTSKLSLTSSPTDTTTPTTPKGGQASPTTTSKEGRITPTPRSPDKQQPTTMLSPSPSPTPALEGDSGGRFYHVPDAQVQFDFPEAVHTDTEIKVMPVWKYMQRFTWTLTKTAVDGSEQPAELANAVTRNLELEGGTIKFKKDGKYTLTATAINARGKETVLSKTVTVYPVIDLTFELPETTHTDKSVTIAFPLKKLYGHDIVWTAKKDGEKFQPADILDGTLDNSGTAFVFKTKGSYALTATITDETGRIFTHTEKTKVYPVSGIAFTLPAASHTDTTVDVTTKLTEVSGFPVIWSLTKNGEVAALSDELEGILTDAGGNIRFKAKGVYMLTGTLTDETGRTYETSQSITVYPVGSVGFYLPEIAHTDTSILIKATFQNLGTAKVQWSLTKDGKAVLIADYIEGMLTDTNSTVRFNEKGEYVLKAAFTDPAGRTCSYSAPIKVYPIACITYKLPETAHTDTEISLLPETLELGNLKVEWLLDNRFGFQDLATYIEGTLDNNGGTIRFKHAGTYELIARITDETGRVFLYEDGGKIEVLPVLDISFKLPVTTHTDRTVDLRTLGNNNVLPVEWTFTRDGKQVDLSDVLEGSLNAYGGKIQFKEVGEYTLTASMTDALGRVFSYSDSTSVYPIPSVLLNLSQPWYAGEAGTVSVSGTDLDNLTADWTIIQGDGGAKPYYIHTTGPLTKTGGTITFPTKGQYTLILTMKDPTGRTFVRSQSILVYPIPSMEIRLPTIWHAGEAGMVSVSGTDLENLIAGWTIRPSGGEAKPYSTYASGNLTKEGGTVTIPVKGQYELILTVTDIQGRVFTESRRFTVYPIPNISISDPQHWYVGEGGTVSVDGTDLDNLTADWTVIQGDGGAKAYSTCVSGTLTKNGGMITFPTKGQYKLF